MVPVDGQCSPPVSMPVRTRVKSNGCPCVTLADRALHCRKVSVSLGETEGDVGGPVTSEMTHTQLKQGHHDSKHPGGCSSPVLFKGVLGCQRC